MLPTEKYSKNWVSLSEAAPSTPYSAEYLSLLARKGKLLARKVDNVWYTTESALNDYVRKQVARTRLQNGNRNFVNLAQSLHINEISSLRSLALPTRPQTSKTRAWSKTFLKKTVVVSLALILTLGLGLSVLEKSSPTLASLLKNRIADTTEFAHSQLAGSFSVSGLRDFFSKIFFTPDSPKITYTTPPAPTPPSTPLAITSVTQELNLGSLKSSLKSELESYVLAQIKSASSPVVIYSTSPQLASVDFDAFKTNDIVPEIHYHITNQSDSDADRLSSRLNTLTTDGQFVKATFDTICFSGDTCETSWPSGGSGDAFPFTATSYGVSTSTTIGFLNGFLSTASSTIDSTLLVTGSTNLQNLIFANATGTSATTTNFFSATASSTNLFAQNGNIGALTVTSCIGCGSTFSFTPTTYGVSTSTTIGLLNGFLSTASSTLQNFTFSNATGTNATTTNNLFSSIFSGNSLSIGGSATSTINSSGDLLVVGSTTLQNFTFSNATGTNATTTNFFSATASSTNLLSSLLTVGGNALIVDSSRNVGIGRVNPVSKLHVAGIVSGSGPIFTSESDFASVGNNIVLAFTNNADTVVSHITTVTEATNQAGLTFSTFSPNALTSVEGFRLSGNGNVGIGTTTPTWLLNPFSTTTSQLALSSGAGFAQWAFRNAGGNFYLATTTVAGTATTSISAFEIAANGFGTTTVRGLNISGQATSTSNVGYNITTGCYSILNTCMKNAAIGGAITGGTSGSVLFVDSSGNFAQDNTNLFWEVGTQELGIRTNDPGYPLDIMTGDSVVAARIGSTAAHEMRLTNNSIDVLNQSTAAPLLLNAAGGGVGIDTSAPVGLFDVNSSLVVLATNKVGISTSTPYYNLTIASTTGSQLALSSGAGFAQWAFRNAGGNLYFATTTVAGTATTSLSALTIMGSNNYVGIGTSSPMALLTVAGSNTNAFRVDNGTGTGILTVDSTTASTNSGIDITAGASQTGNLLNFYSSAGTLLSFFTAAGGFQQNISSTTAVRIQNGSAGDVFVVDSTSGLVGIGTASPEEKLTVLTGSDYGFIHTDGTVSVGSFVDGSTGFYGTKTNHPLTFFVNDATEVMTINTNNTVTISGFGVSDDNSRYLCIDAAGASVLLAGSATDGDCDSSSLSVKHDIETLEISALDMVMGFRPVSFIYNFDETNSTMWGFIAEELDAANSSLAGHNSLGAPRSIQKNAVLAVLAKAIQELNEKVDSLGVTITETYARFTNLFADTIHIENQLCVDDVCISKENLKALLLSAGATSTSPPAPQPTPEPESSPEPEPQPEPEVEESEEEPGEESVIEEESTPEPEPEEPIVEPTPDETP